MTRQSLIVIAVEGLRLDHLGCYGGGLAPTPNLDHFAARSCVFDEYWLECPELAAIYGSLRTGKSILDRNSSAIHSADIPQYLFTDRSELSDLAALQDVTHAFVLGESTLAETVCDDWQQCHTAQVLEEAMATWLEATRHDLQSISFIHLKHLYGVWDAPKQWIDQLYEDSSVEVPIAHDEQAFANDGGSDEGDADRRLRALLRSAAQTSVLDRAWEYIEFALEQSGMRESTTVMLLGAAGWPCGERAVASEVEVSVFEDRESNRHAPANMYAESLHVPLLIQSPATRKVGHRCRALCQPHELGELIRRWSSMETEPMDRRFWERLALPNDFALSMLSSHTAVRCLDAIQAIANAPQALPKDDDELTDATLPFASLPLAFRTNYWSLVQTLSPDQQPHAELFVMPEDRWQQSDVANRAVDVSRAIRWTLAQAIRNRAEGSEAEFKIHKNLLMRPE